ncbi:unnamed protein product [Rotaria sp. Silwood1]|nr:unnamed protein product [Rotaria sp. Silwood1]CAF1620677.1 unnamed protein product [Rotaria sp. Silwood1]
MKLNSEIKNQIYSLKLSNKDTYGQIDAFLSMFSFNEFSHLRSLTLSEVEKQNIVKLKSILPLLSQLSSFHMIGHMFEDSGILDNLPMSNLKILSILSLHSIQTCLSDTSNITNLTIYTCSLEHLLYDLFKCFPMLKYLNVQCISRYNHPIKNDSIINKYNGIYLKQLIIGIFEYNFKDFKIFVKQIPNLISLTINTKYDINMINSYKWKKLIQSSLPYLNIFKFKFRCDCRFNNKIILKKFIHFQNDFWLKQHQWYTEYSFEKNFAFIYTIPYISNTFELGPNTKRFPNKLTNNSNIFDEVTDLTLHNEVKKDQNQYYFSNVESLTLRIWEENQNQINIYYLKFIVNLSNLKHLNIYLYHKMLSSKELLKILKESPKLSWITICPNNLKSLFIDDELCKYLNAMIKKLNIYPYTYSSFINLDELKRFCEIFSNIEQLTCFVRVPNDVLFLLNQLSKLSTINVYFPPLGYRDYFSILFEEQSHRLNFIFRVKGIDVNVPELSIWIDRNMN